MPDGDAPKAEIFRQLLANAFFAQFEPESLRSLVAHSMPCHFAAGESLIEQDTRSSELFIIQKGQASVTVTVHGQAQEVARTGPGAILGELSLLRGEAHSARVCARTPVDALKIPADVFRDFMTRDSRSLAALCRVLAQRVHRTTHSLAFLSYIASAVLADDLEPAELAEIKEQTGDIGYFAELFEQMIHYVAERAQRLEAQVEARTRDLTAEIARREKAEADLRRLATTDPLTGANNRRHFFEMADRELKRAKRYDRPVALFMLDIDRFKSINDRYGHSVGDEAIKALVETCTANLRSQDILGRLGGEEFAILVPECARDDAVDLAERLRLKIAAIQVESAQEPVSYTVSIGVTACDPEHPIERALERADKALYEAKKGGRNRVVGA